MTVSLLRTDVAAKDELRKQLWAEMEAFGDKRITVLPGCPERPSPPRIGRLQADTDEDATPAHPKREDGRKVRPQRGLTWENRIKYQKLAKEHGINLREANKRAGWSDTYIHGMLRGEFSPSAPRIADAERIITEMIEEKKNGKRSDAAA